jgi:hypothetical protein
MANAVPAEPEENFEAVPADEELNIMQELEGETANVSEPGTDEVEPLPGEGATEAEVEPLPEVEPLEEAPPAEITENDLEPVEPQQQEGAGVDVEPLENAPVEVEPVPEGISEELVEPVPANDEMESIEQELVAENEKMEKENQMAKAQVAATVAKPIIADPKYNGQPAGRGRPPTGYVVMDGIYRLLKGVKVASPAAAPVAVKRGPGRPPMAKPAVAAAPVAAVKRGPGRPPSVAPAVAAKPVARPVGRPAGSGATATPDMNKLLIKFLKAQAQALNAAAKELMS